MSFWESRDVHSYVKKWLSSKGVYFASQVFELQYQLDIVF